MKTAKKNLVFYSLFTIHYSLFFMFFDKAVFTISLDFELLWGSFDSGKHRKFIEHFERGGTRSAFEMTFSMREIGKRLKCS